ncbi:uncharacterized protein LOC132304042 isoform X2 [Cornus florida]|uniref:uncharacterized protein LOC132304042 isoform X2 n=1 Tax=Cornus florida TaxID=4283 RepID=UPI0028997D79|nr:uncharacterized protein LOC132304042 isoform X2 [Cornus florida]
MDRHKEDRYSDYSDSRRSTHSATSCRSVDYPVPRHDRNYENNYGGSSSGDGHSHLRHHHNNNNNSNGEQNDSIGSGGDGDFASRQFSLAGRKRHFSPDYVDGGSYVKLYVGAIPRTAREENIRTLFGDYGNVIEVVLLKDKRTGQQQESCFVKYATVEEADRAIGELHNQFICPGGEVPIKVRYAEGERERLGAVGTHVCKLYVGCLNKQASKREIEEIFSAYGLVEDVHILRDELKQNRGCGFVQFSSRDMAVAAINALNGTYIMRGCDQPLIVRFADPKKPRTGELRGNSRVGCPGFGPSNQESIRPASYPSDPIAGRELPNVSDPPTTSSSQDCQIRATAGRAIDSLLGIGFPSSAQQQNKQQKVGELDNNTPTPMKRERSVESQVKSSESSAGGNKGNTGLVMAEEFVEKECITKETDLPVIIGLECNGLRGSQTRKSHDFPSEESLKLFRDQNQQLNDSTRHKIKEINQLEGRESNLKKRRGRPPKLPAKSPEPSVAGKEHNGDVVAADEIVVKDCITSEVELPATTGVGSLLSNEYLEIVGDDKKLPNGPMKQKNSKMKTPPSRHDKLSNVKVVEESSRQHEKYLSMRSRTAGLNIESPFQDPQDDSRGEKTAEDFGTDFVTEGAELAIDKLPSSMSDDQPLSMWFEGMHSPTANGSNSQDDSRGEKTAEAFGTDFITGGAELAIDKLPSSLSDDQPLSMWFEGMYSPAVNGSISTAMTVQHIAIQPPAVDANGDIVPVENQSLAFVKISPLWETIETMEVFRVMPQKPHFRPLDNCKESSREGLAIGSMVTFFNVAKKTFELHSDDPRSVIEDGLETLLDLDSHGFDVKLLRDRLTGLLLLKDKQEQLQDQTTELKTRIMEHTHQKSKIDEEIDEIDELIRVLQEKRALVVPLKETKDSEIASLQSRERDIIEDIKSMKLDFEGLAAAPW